MMVHTTLIENPTKKPTTPMSIQPILHQLLKKFHDKLKNDSQLCHCEKILFRNQPFIMKNA